MNDPISHSTNPFIVHTCIHSYFHKSIQKINLVKTNRSQRRDLIPNENDKHQWMCTAKSRPQGSFAMSQVYPTLLMFTVTNLVWFQGTAVNLSKPKDFMFFETWSQIYPLFWPETSRNRTKDALRSINGTCSGCYLNGGTSYRQAAFTAWKGVPGSYV